MSASLTWLRSPSSSRSTCVQPSCTRTWSIRVRSATPWSPSLRFRVPGCMPLRDSMPLMASAICLSLMITLRRCSSCRRRRSSISCLVTCGRSRASTSGVNGSPVDSANSRALACTSASLTMSPLTTATIPSLAPTILPAAELADTGAAARDWLPGGGAGVGAAAATRPSPGKLKTVRARAVEVQRIVRSIAVRLLRCMVAELPNGLQRDLEQDRRATRVIVDRGEALDQVDVEYKAFVFVRRARTDRIELTRAKVAAHAAVELVGVELRRGAQHHLVARNEVAGRVALRRRHRRVGGLIVQVIRVGG